VSLVASTLVGRRGAAEREGAIEGRDEASLLDIMISLLVSPAA
jgi:hypothetical protein